MKFSPDAYPGTELELFESAQNWKRYVQKTISPFIRQNVLEVGAGIGGTTATLCDGTQSNWLCLEPDPSLGATLEEKIRTNSLCSCCDVSFATLKSLPNTMRFDTILYIDVLEHIEDDIDEIETALKFLDVGGHLVVLAPAHPWLYSPFDAAVGHYRRYTRTSLLKLAPHDLEPVLIRYLDSVGMFASAANRIILKEDQPSSKQIEIWDRFMVPLSKLVDPLLLNRVGKSVVVVWRRTH